MKFVNSKFGKKKEYYEYVGSFGSDLAEVPKIHKGSKPYRCGWYGWVVYLCERYKGGVGRGGRTFTMAASRTDAFGWLGGLLV